MQWIVFLLGWFVFFCLFFFSITVSHAMFGMYLCLKIIFVSLMFKFNWAYCILSGNPIGRECKDGEWSLVSCTWEEGWQDFFKVKRWKNYFSNILHRVVPEEEFLSQRIKSSCRESKPIKLFQELFRVISENYLPQLLPGPDLPQPDLVRGKGYEGVKWGWVSGAGGQLSMEGLEMQREKQMLSVVKAA